MPKTLLLLFVASLLNATFGTVWKRSMSITPYTTLLAIGGMTVGLFGLIMTVKSGRPVVPAGQYMKLWPLVAAVVLIPLFYMSVSVLVKQLPFSRVYPMISAGTMIFAVLIDWGSGVDAITPRKIAGIFLAMSAIWCIRG